MKALFARIQIYLLAALLFHSLTSNSQPVITTQPTNLIVLLGSNATFSVVVSNSGPLAYQWRLGGTNISGIIVGVAGGHPVGDYYGDGCPASMAVLHRLYGMAFDGAGNLFMADTINNRVRKIDPNGVINLVAGNGIGAYSGDGAAATNTSTNEPMAMAVDSSWQLFIADWLNNRLRKVDINGIITTVTGNEYGALTGSGIYTGEGGPATSASLWGPRGVALDVAGNLFICASANKTYKEYDSRHPILRRWDQSDSSGELVEGALLIKDDQGKDYKNWIMLEDGVQIQFTLLPPGSSNTFYRARDYWLIPARMATGDVLWPKEFDVNNHSGAKALPPHGFEHHHAPLAVIELSDKGTFDSPVTDMRRTFTPLAI